MKLFNLIPIFTLALSVGCVSTITEKVEQDIAKQPESTAREAAASGRKAIMNSSNLSAEQKAKMLSMMDKIQSEMAILRQNEAQTKSSLFKYLAAGNFEEREISTYRSKLERLENQKMNLVVFESKRDATNSCRRNILC